MIIFAIDQDNITDWAKEELWLDWFTGYLCRRAVFEKDKNEKPSLVFSPNIQNKILIVSSNVSKEHFASMLTSIGDGQVIASERSQELLSKWYNSQIKKLNFTSLKEYLAKVAGQDIRSHLGLNP